MAFIRPFRPEDTEDAKHICRATLPPSLLSSPRATSISPYLWTLPFTHLFSSHCHILDDGAGRAVGYVIGTPDVFALAAEYPRYVAEVLGSPLGRGEEVNPEALVQLAYKVEWLVLEGVEGKRELVEEYRAMLHIDLLEPWQGKGWGRKMIERFVEGVKGEGKERYGKGIQLGVAGENTKVVGFYERLGFRVFPGGEREGNVWMVLDL
ncbi:acyl-CoA N-acyltransferase [Chaetomium sp. MPI-SDFR-AT-0129]|nr:acyl-CoA N-acyltransferase [Chaetomium sp. MPI-SDFR-AT-0129]